MGRIYDAEGYDKRGFDRNGIHKETGTLFDNEGINKQGQTKAEVLLMEEEERERYSGWRNKVDELITGELSIIEFLKNSPVSLNELIERAKKEKIPATLIRRLYKILPQYNAYKKPFSKEEYLKTSSVMIDGKLVKASEEEIDKCIEYMKQKNEWISGKTVSDCIRDYLKGEKDITLEVELSDLNNIQKDLEKRIEKIDRMEEKIKLKSRELGESER